MAFDLGFYEVLYVTPDKNVFAYGGAGLTGIDLYNMKEPDTVPGHSKSYYSSELVITSSVASKQKGRRKGRGRRENQK